MPLILSIEILSACSYWPTLRMCQISKFFDAPRPRSGGGGGGGIRPPPRTWDRQKKPGPFRVKLKRGNFGSRHCLTKCALENKLLNQNWWSWYNCSHEKLPQSLIPVITSTYCRKYAIPFFLGHPVYLKKKNSSVLGFNFWWNCRIQRNWIHIITWGNIVGLSEILAPILHTFQEIWIWVHSLSLWKLLPVNGPAIIKITNRKFSECDWPGGMFGRNARSVCSYTMYRGGSRILK